MKNRFARELSFGKRVLLASVVIVAIAGPMAVGLMNAPLGRAQSPKAAASNLPAFEVASVRRAAPQGEGGPGQARSAGLCREDPGRISCIGSPLKLVLIRAYDVKSYQVLGPAWMETEKYDIIATEPAGATKAQTSAMLQRLLVDRFRMSVRRESRELPVYALVVGKNGPKLKKSTDPDDHAGFTWGNGHLRFRVPTLDHLARGLTFWMGRPVIDMTGIEGRFDIALDISTEGLAGVHLTGGPTDGDPPTASDPAPSVFTAVQEFGLRLESRKAPIECIVIDKAEKVPVAN
jgi:uncharacterized protein (TIGR03435 family)